MRIAGRSHSFLSSIPFVWGSLLVLLLASGCGSSKPYTLGSIQTTDPDTRPTDRPAETLESMYWDRIDMSVFHQLEKPLNLNWTGRKVGRALGVADADQADNVNVLDEPPNSSWWKRRHFYSEMSPRELAIGPNERDTTGVAAGPSQEGPWTVTSGKFQGAARGFEIEDPRGDRYLIKLDGPEWPELTTSAEVISTKIFYGAGYHVPQNTITRFAPDQLRIADDARVDGQDGRRPMTREDLRALLKPYDRGPDGTIRGLASKFVEGEPLGPIFFQGTREGDANDRVRHEQRRELRGLRVLSAWLNDADRRHANTLAVYTDEQYVKHYLLDMGSTLGANAQQPHRPIYGQAYIIDQRKILTALPALGAYRFPWWHYDWETPYSAVGYFPADVFTPGEWVPTYPNPAFEKLTDRDGYWGAKLVMSFSDEDIEAIVETAQISTPAAEAHLIDVLQRRRDKVGRYWFDRVNPLDRFSVTTSAPVAEAGSGPSSTSPRLQFDDLSVEGNLARAEARTYAYRMHLGDTPLGPRDTTASSQLPLTVDDTALGTVLDDRNRSDSDERVVRIDLRTRHDGSTSDPTRVYVHLPSSGAPRVVGLERE
ncbi:MAG: hypothetical protein V5A20_11840 [Salinibacter sp.]|uniref:hypothetical protein n=1 Tax=Salinibacter sp. TaxID=2065818 RepID=UPI002FC32E6A